MAARTPSAYTQYIDVDSIIPRAEIILTQPNQIINDQHAYLDRSEMLASMMWNPVYSSSDSWVTVCRFHLRGADMCGATDGNTRYWCVYAWTDNVAVGGDVRLLNNGTAASSSITIGVPRIIPMYRGWGSGAATLIAGDDSDNDISLQTKAAENGVKVFTAGLGIFVG